ncbi:MAG TPA: glutamate--tRNA ligase family protein [Candidatus Pacearchaeota archaeon]|jgi:glutamyl-tRNA synthetase|nr:glutamate--tRNA ligase family protein [Candidatus Pacearchaeota archaeon]HPX74559.1 glutamate--tRNA ligase family protein [Candidatus Pacearchaeota archaeon]HQC60973.1 glutamate--tRNA ligase family protein [Candidatus Pacearchaeota archaeon]
MKDFEKKAKAHALKNAIRYNGKASPGAVISGLFAEGLKKEEVKEYSKKINEIVVSVNKLSLDEQKKEYEKLQGIISEREVREGLEELPNVPKSGVVMRFAPAASGPMHLGHAITGTISSLYVKKYGGKFYLRIEDTNPDKVFSDCYKSFKEDSDWLFGNVTEYIIQSDRMEIYYKYAEKFLRKGAAYICTCSPEKFKGFVNLKENCPCRNNDLKENLYRWKKMLSKDSKENYKQGSAILRFKSSMQDSNPAMRDFPLARINENEHPRQKKKYRVWPLMNLSVTVDDIEYGMTHIIRAKEHMDNAKRQKMMYKVLGLEKKFPWTYFMGRIKFNDLPLSKRKIVAAIESGDYEGWEDIRLPTLFALKKRGYKPEAFFKFAEQRGLTDVDKVMDSKDLFKILDTFNK